MAQTTGAFSAKDAVVEYSIDSGSNWKALSGHANKVTASGGEREVEGTDTFDGDTPAVTPGKRKISKVKIDFIYTETSGEAQRDAETAHRAGSVFMVRWTGKAATTGNRRYTSDTQSYLTAPMLPDVDAGSAKAIMASIEITTKDVAPAAIP